MHRTSRAHYALYMQLIKQCKQSLLQPKQTELGSLMEIQMQDTHITRPSKQGNVNHDEFKIHSQSADDGSSHGFLLRAHTYTHIQISLPLLCLTPEPSPLKCAEMFKNANMFSVQGK